MPVRDLEKSSSFDTKDEIKGDICFSIRVQCTHRPILVDTCYICQKWELARFQTFKVIFGVIEAFEGH